MILVTVGTHSQGFNRLIRAADELAMQIDEEIMIQFGSSSYIPKHADSIQWLTFEQIDKYTDDARVVIGHAGSGTIITTLLKNKPLVIVPRLKKYKEHIDDHQMQLAFILNAQGKAIFVEDPTAENLTIAIDLAVELNSIQVKSDRLIHALKEQLNYWSDNLDNPKKVTGKNY